MSQWKKGNIEEWPASIAIPISLEAFEADSEFKIFYRDEGDWAMVVSGPEVESKISFLYEQIRDWQLEFHRLGFLQSVDENKNVSEAVLESLMQHCDLVAVPHPIAIEGRDFFSPGRIFCLNSETGNKQEYNLFQLNPADEHMMTDGAPINPADKEDLDAREKWFRDRH